MYDDFFISDNTRSSKLSGVRKLEIVSISGISDISNSKVVGPGNYDIIVYITDLAYNVEHVNLQVKIIADQ